MSRVPEDPTEAALLAQIDLGDDAGRAVYADWLEDHGEPERAEFLRLQRVAATTRATDPAFAPTVKRLRELAATLDIGWRMRIARTVVDVCIAKEFTCSVEWGSLERTASPAERRCGECKQSVFYCRDESSALAHVTAGHCVVIDIASTRSQPFAALAQIARRQPHTPQAPIRPGMYMPWSQDPRPPTPPDQQCPFCRATTSSIYGTCATCGRRI